MIISTQNISNSIVMTKNIKIQDKINGRVNVVVRGATQWNNIDRGGAGPALSALLRQPPSKHNTMLLSSLSMRTGIFLLSSKYNI